MTAVAKPNLHAYFLDKKATQKLVAEQNRLMGFVPDPTADATTRSPVTPTTLVKPAKPPLPELHSVNSRSRPLGRRGPRDKTLTPPNPGGAEPTECKRCRKARRAP